LEGVQKRGIVKIRVRYSNGRVEKWNYRIAYQEGTALALMSVNGNTKSLSPMSDLLEKGEPGATDNPDDAQR